jgi:hypothetical protein
VQKQRFFQPERILGDQPRQQTNKRQHQPDTHDHPLRVFPNCFCLFFYFHEFPAFLIFLYHKKATHLSV